MGNETDNAERSVFDIELDNVAGAATRLAKERFGDFGSLHEAMSALREEFDDLWDICKIKPRGSRSNISTGYKAVHVAACALRIAAQAFDDRDWGERAIRRLGEGF
jgi:hypothetical protein